MEVLSVQGFILLHLQQTSHKNLRFIKEIGILGKQMFINKLVLYLVFLKCSTMQSLAVDKSPRHGYCIIFLDNKYISYIIYNLLYIISKLYILKKNL